MRRVLARFPHTAFTSPSRFLNGNRRPPKTLESSRGVWGGEK